jgi:FixJ family two-component response regulator
MTSAGVVTVFIIDDDAEMRTAIEALLQSAGLRILAPIRMTTIRS